MASHKLIKEEKVSRVLVLYEFLLGVIETILGTGILLYGRRLFLLYLDLRDEELLVHPNAILIKMAESIIPGLFERRFYVVGFLLFLGIVKIVASWGMWKGKVWGITLISILIFCLLPFEIVTILMHFTLAKLFYIVLNVTIILYLNREKAIEKSLED